MSRTPFVYHVDDISALARSLKAQMADRTEPLGHVELLNMLARGAGFRNFQHFRAQAEAFAALEAPPAPPPPTIDLEKVRRLLRYFGPEGRLTRWPSKYSHQGPCLWVLWSRIPPRRSFSEREVNMMLTANHDFGDYALLRRELCNYGMMVRTVDGRVYRRIEREPPPEALALIRHLAGRKAA